MKTAQRSRQDVRSFVSRSNAPRILVASPPRGLQLEQMLTLHLVVRFKQLYIGRNEVKREKLQLLTPSRTLTSLTRDEDFGPNMNSTSRTRGRKLEPNINITSETREVKLETNMMHNFCQFQSWFSSY